MNKIAATLLLLLTASISFSQNIPVSGSETWIKDISESKIFIENNGQFSKYKTVQNSAVVYGTEDKGIEMYFTSKGWFYRLVRVERENKEEEREREKEREQEKEAGKITAQDESKYRRKKTKRV